MYDKHIFSSFESVLKSFKCLHLAQVSAVALPCFLELFSSVGVFVHTPTLGGAAVTPGWLKVAFLSTMRNLGA